MKRTNENRRILARRAAKEISAAELTAISGGGGGGTTSTTQDTDCGTGGCGGDPFLMLDSNGSLR